VLVVILIVVVMVICVGSVIAELKPILFTNDFELPPIVMKAVAATLEENVAAPAFEIPIFQHYQPQ
jgi:hypothetical protein